MNTENLVKIRNILKTFEGSLILELLQDYITENACKNREASEIKGMCELVQMLKNVPKEVDRKNK